MAKIKQESKEKQEEAPGEEGHHLKHEVTHSTVEVGYNTLKCIDQLRNEIDI